MRKKAVYEGAKRGRKSVDRTGQVHHGLTVIAMIRRDPHGPKAKRKGNQRVQVQCRCGRPDCKGIFIAVLSHVIAGRASCRESGSKSPKRKDWNKILVNSGLSIERGLDPRTILPPEKCEDREDYDAFLQIMKDESDRKNADRTLRGNDIEDVYDAECASQECNGGRRTGPRPVDN